MKHLLLLFAAVIMLVLFSSCSDSSSGVEDDGERISLDLRIFLMESDDSANLTSTLSEEEVNQMMAEVNEVWQQAGILWNVVSVEKAEPLNVNLFEQMMRGQFPFSGALLRSTIPDNVTRTDAFDVFLIRDFGGRVGGIYFPDVTAVLQPEIDPSGGDGLRGGLTRILAHELGHSLSLPHVACNSDGNLMAPGCIQGNRTRLGSSQIQSARRQALSGRPAQ